MNNCEQTIVLLVTHDHITPEEAKLHGNFNLKGRIADIRGAVPFYTGKRKVKVKTEMRKQPGANRRYARYSLDAAEKARVKELYPHLFKVAA